MTVINTTVRGCVKLNVKFYQNCSEGNYPETLKAAYVINASTVFQLIFRVVQSSVQQKTLKKIKVFGSGSWEEIESLLSSRPGRPDICSGGTVPQTFLFSRDEKVRRITVEPRQVITFTFSPSQACQLRSESKT